MSETYITALIILGFIALSLLIVVLIYTIISTRRKNIVYKKVDYLVEDLTYKSETLNSTVETVAKLSNYFDIFETVTRKNLKSGVKILARNKDDIYKIVDRLKRIAIGEQDKNIDEEKNKNVKKKGDN